MIKKNDEKDAPTGHKHVPGDLDQPAAGNPDGTMPMGMTGADGGADPDQKSTHNAPATVESNLPDGSPKFQDAKAGKKVGAAKAGKYEVVSRISTKAAAGDSTKRNQTMTHEPGAIVELDAAEAASLGDSVKPAR